MPRGPIQTVTACCTPANPSERPPATRPGAVAKQNDLASACRPANTVELRGLGPLTPTLPATCSIIRDCLPSSETPMRQGHPDKYRTPRTTANEANGYQNGYQMITYPSAALFMVSTALRCVVSPAGSSHRSQSRARGFHRSGPSACSTRRSANVATARTTTSKSSGRCAPSGPSPAQYAA